LPMLSPTHHGPLPRIAPGSNGITVHPSPQREFCNTFHPEADFILKSPACRGRVNFFEKVGAFVPSNFFSALHASFGWGRGGPHRLHLTQRTELQIDLQRQLASIEDIVGISTDFP
jgi:hypothetical protein